MLLRGWSTTPQIETPDVLGWSRGKVSNYDMLDDITKDAWAIIATTSEEREKPRAESAVAANATNVGDAKKGGSRLYL